ncbi:acetyl-CoA C-acyltransferase / 3-ketoacyl-CoA thiolase [Reticulomyxa filosa]|uniref:Acetyl-CoA C-acyltransferase / 3-ketoacyl-CoA thiolase n=1 Tax=Reticulomyxa filosa TaxID=46433 RepID=X6MRI1_RETFI|nr:acetyl-CoA C-acyltransferase / 3-ketoacyl-CoA thiolase [Reticulomyxa filosa]|eukprot:ETO16394.1 acetyl-CoA C-acyltransferase / 3-ketoacyl-CoA thiolase [Reticulomyxa filosa]
MSEEKQIEIKDSDVFILAAVRTPLGSFGGSLSSLSAVELGAITIKGALEKAEIKPSQVDEVFMGNVLQANLGQNPARQASIKSGISDKVPATTVNVVCASGMKAVSLAAQSLALQQNEICIAGGMESMSNAPYYVQVKKKNLCNIIPSFSFRLFFLIFNFFFFFWSLSQMFYNSNNMTLKKKKKKKRNYRFGVRFGDQTMVDGLTKDGLWDTLAHKEHAFDNEILPIPILNPKTKTKDIVSIDEGISKLNEEKMRQLKGAFPITNDAYKSHPNIAKDKDNHPIYTVTAANSSSLSDGAAALVLINGKKVKELKCHSKLLAKIAGFADAAQEPVRFPATPSLAIPKALKHAGIHDVSDLNENDWFEINEAFSVAGVANARILKIPMERVNALGGAIALGHPLGCSGARILCTLITTLKLKKGRYGVAGICNGGGGASAIVLQNI